MRCLFWALAMIFVVAVVVPAVVATLAVAAFAAFWVLRFMLPWLLVAMGVWLIVGRAGRRSRRDRWSRRNRWSNWNDDWRAWGPPQPNVTDVRGKTVTHGFIPRTTFVIAKDGKIVSALSSEEDHIKPDQHVTKALAIVQQMQSGKAP